MEPASELEWEGPWQPALGIWIGSHQDRGMGDRELWQVREESAEETLLGAEGSKQWDFRSGGDRKTAAGTSTVMRRA